MPTKKCTRCNVVKELTQFHKRNNSPIGYRPACKQCVKAKAQTYYKAHKTQIDASNKIWKLANPEKNLESIQNWHKQNPEARITASARYYVKHKDKCAEKLKRWQKENPEKCRAYSASRRATLLNAITPTTCLKTVETIYAQCPKGYEVDHKIPLARRGAHHQDNLCFITKALNARKGKKLLSEHPLLKADFDKEVIYPKY